MPVTRSKIGCFTCRRRKKKCSEHRPTCDGCRRNQLSCVWPRAPEGESLPHDNIKKPIGAATRSIPEDERRNSSISVDITHEAPQQRPSSQVDGESEEKEVQQAAGAQTPAEQDWLGMERRSTLRWPSPTLVDIWLADGDFESASLSLHPGQSASSINEDVRTRSSISTQDAPQLPSSPRRTESSSHENDAQDLEETNQVINEQDQISTDLIRESIGSVNETVQTDLPVASLVTSNLTSLFEFDDNSHQLLSYYLVKTANSMGNGSTDVNPFIAQLIPVAFSTPIILQLILAQSAVHRKASNDDYSSIDVSTKYYVTSLQLLRDKTAQFNHGSASERLLLTLGILTMSLTEVARGEIDGTTFDHLIAAESLVSGLLEQNSKHASGDLFDFMIEYFIHMSTTSILSIDAQYTKQHLLTPSIVKAAEDLAGRNYVGQLCGSWIGLLVLIPQIFQLGQSLLPASCLHGRLSPPPEDFIVFGLLQSQILAFEPPVTMNTATYLASLVFKQATLLYLWSMLLEQSWGTQSNEQTATPSHISSAVDEAMALLDQIPLTERVNTSLCWPLTIIGCCTADKEQREKLRYRLQSMSQLLGLGNIKATLDLMERVWAEETTTISPWTLCKSMQKYQIWLSFA